MSETSLWTRLSVARSVCHNFLKGLQETLLCSYRSTCSSMVSGHSRAKRFVSLSVGSTRLLPINLLGRSTSLCLSGRPGYFQSTCWVGQLHFVRRVDQVTSNQPAGEVNFTLSVGSTRLLPIKKLYKDPTAKDGKRIGNQRPTDRQTGSWGSYNKRKSAYHKFNTNMQYTYKFDTFEDFS